MNDRRLVRTPEPSIRVKMAFILGITLLPLGIIAIYQTTTAGQEAGRLSRLALLSATEEAASDDLVQ